MVDLKYSHIFVRLEPTRKDRRLSCGVRINRTMGMFLTTVQVQHSALPAASNITVLEPSAALRSKSGSALLLVCDYQHTKEDWKSENALTEPASDVSEVTCFRDSSC